MFEVFFVFVKYAEQIAPQVLISRYKSLSLHIYKYIDYEIRYYLYRKG